MLHGRERELELLRTRLREARDGRSFSLVLAGEAGIGKSVLLQQVLAEAGDFRVLRARGFESETEIPYAGLLEVVRPLLDLAEGLPEQQAAALRSALALGPPTPHDRFAVPVAVLGLLGAAAEEGPVLVVVDDAHWLDPATREALLFTARRLDAEGVGIVLSVRTTDDGPPVDVAGLEVLTLAGLDGASARSLLADVVAPSVVDALVGATGGNPLALVELPSALTEDERTGLRPIDALAGTSGRVEQLFSDRVAALPERTRRALGAAAAVEDGGLSQLFGALRRLELDEDDLGPAEQTGVVTILGTRLQFRHPLVRAAAYRGQTVAERHAAHAALAESAPDVRAAAWHRAQAATGPDEVVAAALADAADDALRRGGRAEAVQTFVRAADLTPDPALAAARRLAAAAAAHEAGDGAHADALLSAAEAGPLADEVQGDARRLRALLAARAGDTPGGVRILEQEAARLAGTDPVQAGRTLLLTAPAFMHSGDFVAMLDAADRAGALVGDGDPAAAAMAADVAAVARSAVGWLEGGEGRASLEAAARRSVTSGVGEVAIASAEGELLRERLTIAREALDDHVDDARRAGAVLMLLYALAVRSQLGHRAGRWAEARADAEEAVALQGDVGQDTIFSAYAFATAAVLRMDAGRLEEAGELVAQSLASAERVGAATILLWAHWARGRHALLDDRPGDAVEALREVALLTERLMWQRASAAVALADLGDALIADGSPDDVAALAAALREDGARAQLRFPIAAAARLEGRIAADDDVAEERFAESLALLAAIAMPFEHARTLLAQGLRRQAGGATPEATRAVLQEALSAFERLGAGAWAERTRTALRRAGARDAPAPQGDPSVVLSGQEWRVAKLVAEGMTNREVGSELFLSPKTIEHHLSGIYRKLGVRSRTQLAALIER